MPPAIAYQPDNRDVRKAAADELSERRKESKHGWEYYEGEHKKPLLTKTGETEDNIVINLVKPCVDRTVSFLAGKFPGLETGNNATDAWLRSAWKVNGDVLLLMKFARFGAINGHCFARVIPPTEQGAYPRIVALNPANVIAFWAEDDVENVLWYEVYFGKRRQDIVRFKSDLVDLGDGTAGPVDGWEIRTYVKTGVDELSWKLEMREFWPSARGPIVDWQHSVCATEYYGESEVEDVALNDAVNKIASDISRILRYHGAPRTVAIGVETDEQIVKTAIGNLWAIANPDAKVENLEMKSELVPSMNFLNTLTAAYLSQARVVMLKGDIADFQRVTNLGMRALFIDALAKNEELQLQYQLGITAISQRLAELGGQDVPETVETHWADPLPVDPMLATQIGDMQLQMGVVSKETVSKELGRDPAVEQARIENETATAATSLFKAMQQ